MATIAEVRNLLAVAELPDEVSVELVDGLAGIWLLNEPAETLAADLAHCYPPPQDDEVRVSHRPGEDGAWRLVVVGRDRPGLLARTAGVLAGSGLSVRTAGVTTWPAWGMALQGLTVEDPGGRGWADADWDALQRGIEAAWTGSMRPDVTWHPHGDVKVMASPVATGENLVTVEAPDRIGLLWAIASWFYGRGINVQAAALDERQGLAVDTFLVDGEPPMDVDGLAAYLVGRVSLRQRWLRRIRVRS